MPRKSTLPPDAPVWVTEDRKIDEMTFCCSFLEAHPMKCVHGKLYTVGGLVHDEAALKREIFMEICDWITLDRSRCQALFLSSWGIQSVRAGFYFYARDPGPGMDGLLWTGGGSRRCMGGIQKKEGVCKAARRDYPEGQTEEDGRCHGNP